MPYDFLAHNRKPAYVTPFIVLFWIATLVATFDAIRRPAVAWVGADRSRSFWVSGLVISSLMLLPAVVLLPAYFVGVMPLMGVGKPARSPNATRTRTQPVRGGSVDEFRRR